jgi:hypothetical protein
VKECCGLVDQTLEFTLIVADGKGNESREGAQIWDAGAV